MRDVYPLSLPLDYEPADEQRLGDMADRRRRQPIEVLYDHLTAGDGGNVAAQFCCNYADGNLDAMREMLDHPLVISGLGDGGAHAQLDLRCVDDDLAADLLGARPQARAEARRSRHIVAQDDRRPMRGCTASTDRGVLADRQARRPQRDRLRPAGARPARDAPRPALGRAAPAAGRQGYVATMVAGTVTRRNDAETGARPGRLVRSTPVTTKVAAKEAAVA